MATSTIKAGKTLLWTNASPTAAFSEQTVALDLSNYGSVEVIYKLHAGQSVYVAPQRVTKDIETITVSASGAAGFFAGAIAMLARSASLVSSGVHFSAASLATTSAAWSVDNLCLIPYKIYGIK